MSYGYIKDNLKNNILINDFLIMDYIHTRINEESINDLVNCVSTTDIGESYYDPENKELCINTEEIFENNIDNNIPDLLKLISKKDKKYYKLDNPNYGNIYNLFTINHEIAHLVQKREIISNDDILKKNLFYFGKIIEAVDNTFFKSFYYHKFHDRFYNEYNANIEAYFEVIALLNAYKLNNLNDDLVKLNNIAAKHIIYLYSDINKKGEYSTPVRNSLKIYKHMLEVCKKHDVQLDIEKDIILNIEKEQPEDELNRILLGYSLSTYNYYHLKDIANGKVKTLNLFDEINY